jgi:hypothetical protein
MHNRKSLYEISIRIFISFVCFSDFTTDVLDQILSDFANPFLRSLNLIFIMIYPTFLLVRWFLYFFFYEPSQGQYSNLLIYFHIIMVKFISSVLFAFSEILKIFPYLFLFESTLKQYNKGISSSLLSEF